MRHSASLSTLIVTFLAAGWLASGTPGGADSPGDLPGARSEAAAAPAGGGVAAPRGTAYNGPFLQPYLPSWLGFNVQARGRVDGPAGIGYSRGADDLYFDSRLRFDLSVRPSSWLRFFAEAQDSRAFGYNTPVPSSIYNPWDLRQAYMEVAGGESGSLLARLGRQELIFGSARLIGAPEFSNTGKSFDALRGSVTWKMVKADVFAGSVVQIDSGRFDRHKSGEHIYGTYFSIKTPIRGMTLEPYLFARTQLGCVGERGDRGNSHLYTGGIRMLGKLPGRMDYGVEVMPQWGYAASDQIRALAGAYDLGWTILPYGWKPRLSFDINFASGDRGNKDGYRNTFDQLYPGGIHSTYGIADQSGERNIRQYKTGIDVSPSAKLKASVDYREMYLATVQDGFYNASGTRVVLNRNATSRHVGSEVDLQATYVLPYGVNFGVGVAHIFAGPYLKQSTGGSGYTYPYLMWSRRF